MSASQTVTIADLLRLLREVAGEAELPDDDLIDTEFEELGYDSVAVMEANARLVREFGRNLDLEEVDGARTPRQLLDLVNKTVIEA
ncbi:acyl carrier protein [Nocardia jinanensis]|uniref:Actinorhodin polyketide synthase acyl carrier protein n=1 Tax=Nocardia jinanensis TaxID=382504 RepID=A0A917RYM6_9NOCA|nr:acyl carrier protein [Nocardia jinanensis]GGL46382.1 actinorhodin polyketide synthase acyl carrier protein [Nocardia jinanensis]